jgi:hypothetical protein
MSRQIALGAVLAFGVTVVILSLWSAGEVAPELAPLDATPTPVLETALAPMMLQVQWRDGGAEDAGAKSP